MKRCEAMRDAMVAVLFDEADEQTRAAFAAHADECPACADTLAQMRETLAVTRRRARPDPGAAFWAAFADRVEARVARAERPAGEPETHAMAWWRRRVGGARATWGLRVAAAAAILVIGVLAGRTIFAPGSSPQNTGELAAHAPRGGDTPAGGAEKRTSERGGTGIPDVEPEPTPPGRSSPPPDVQLASSSERALCYVEKSQLLLLALVNSDAGDDGYATELAAQRERSGTLLAEAPSIRAALDDPRQRRLRKLVGDLEMILREIANLESESDVEAVEFIRGRVDRHDVLLKIDLEQLRYGTGDDACRAEPESRGDGNGTDDLKRSI
ncbi:MAG: zf-HC2 domain-containing protein [Candidatus Krumholzibacteria bacterium]|nr:zf-HC2 domain-containing protein [Candidatus Krumholzibacteria bacterium]